MPGYDESTYGERIAETYDTRPEIPTDTDDTVAFLAEVAGKGLVLELGIGTGRIALPLARRGLQVSGIDASPAMVAKLRQKPGGSRIPVTPGSFADVGVEGRFTLVYVVFNTFFGLLSQEDQVRCFANVAARLEPAGVFVIEAFVPDLTLFDRGQRVNAIRIDDEEVILDASRLELGNQTIRAQHVHVRDGTVKLFPVQIRYAWPSELDLMARLAGMRLRERWAGWRREAFTADSRKHVSVYQLIRPG
jgi:SAM-dependent methyltransferase